MMHRHRLRPVWFALSRSYSLPPSLPFPPLCTPPPFLSHHLASSAPVPEQPLPDLVAEARPANLVGEMLTCALTHALAAWVPAVAWPRDPDDGSAHIAGEGTLAGMATRTREKDGGECDVDNGKAVAATVSVAHLSFAIIFRLAAEEVRSWGTLFC